MVGGRVQVPVAAANRVLIDPYPGASRASADAAYAEPTGGVGTSVVTIPAASVLPKQAA